MQRAQLIPLKRSTFHEYHLKGDDALIHRSLFLKRKNLENPTLEKWFDHFKNHGILNLDTVQNTYIYALIIDFLAKKEPVHLLHFDNYDHLKIAFPECPIVKIEWKFSLEHTYNDQPLCRQYGFQNPGEFLKQMDYFDKSLSNRAYYLTELTIDKLDVFTRTSSSDVGLWSFVIGAETSSLTKLLRNKEERPSIDQMLQIAQSMVHVQVGADEKYLDYVLIHSWVDLQNDIVDLESCINQFGADLEKTFQDLDNSE